MNNGYIKIEPPFDPNSLKESATIELKDAAKTEEKKKKSSVREKLEEKSGKETKATGKSCQMKN